MVVLASVKVDLRRICEDDAREILKRHKLKNRDKYYEDNIVYFPQIDLKSLEKDGYVFDGDCKLCDNIWLRMFKNDDRSNEISKKSILEMYRNGSVGSSKDKKSLTSPKKSLSSPKKTSSSSLSSPKSNLKKKVAKKASKSSVVKFKKESDYYSSDSEDDLKR